MENKSTVKKKVGSYLFIFGCIILGLVLAINVYIMVQSKINPDKVPSVFGYKPFIVLSGSMETKIHKGDLVLTKVVNPKTLKKNDIIAFRDSADTVTTHRIIDIAFDDNRKYFITKGDNNLSQDQNLVKFKDVEGLYMFRVPTIGSAMDALAKPTTIVIVLLIITILFVLGFTISTKKQRELEQKEFMEFKKLKDELKKDINKKEE